MLTKQKSFISLFLISLTITGCTDTDILPTTTTDDAKPKTVALDSSFLDSPIGWTDESSQKTVKIKITKRANETYECRIGHISEIENKSFSACAPNASGFVTFDQPTSGIKNGTFEVQVRSVVDGKKSTPTSSDQFYVHDSLDEVAKCTLPENDAHYFNIAAQYLDQSLVYESDTSLKNPFITLSFPVVPAGNYLFPDGTTTDAHPGDVAESFDLRSLRKTFVLNSAKTLMLIKRKYVNRYSNSGCANSVKNMAKDVTESVVDLLLSQWPAPTSHPNYNQLWTQTTGGYPCDVFVMNAQRKFVCFSGAELRFGSKAVNLLKTRIRTLTAYDSVGTHMTSSKFTAAEQALYDSTISEALSNGDVDALEHFIFLEE